MLKSALLVGLLFSNIIYANPHVKEEFEVIPLNSPVKEAAANFQLVLPLSLKIDHLFYKIKNASKEHGVEIKLNHRETIELKADNKISIPVSKLPPGHYQLHLWVKSKHGQEFKCSRKKQSFAKFIIDDSLQVPMPDAKINNSTLAGVDSDNDGIRDDIQRWINEKFGNRPSFKEGLKQYARSEQKIIINADNKQSTIVNINKMAETFDCLGWINPEDDINQTRILSSLFKNTELRVKTRLKASSHYHGQGTPETITNLKREERNQLCDFEAVKEVN